jgi:hypothetical protein
VRLKALTPEASDGAQAAPQATPQALGMQGMV